MVVKSIVSDKMNFALDPFPPIQRLFLFASSAFRLSRFMALSDSASRKIMGYESVIL